MKKETIVAKNKEHLIKLIEYEIVQYGNKCDLNQKLNEELKDNSLSKKTHKI